MTPDFPPLPGGIQLLIHRLVSNFRDVDPRVVALGAAGAESFDSESPLDVVRVARKGGALHRLAVARLNAAGIRQALDYRPQVIVSGHAVTAPASALMRSFGRVPVIQYLYADEFRFRPRLVRFAVHRADAVIAISRHTRDMALASGCDPDRLTLVLPAVDPRPPVVRDPAERPTVITVARLVDQYKGHDMMIRALPLIQARVPEVEWVVIGDGPLRPSLEELAASEGVADAVRFLGRVSDEERDKWLARAHVFAMPSRLPPGGVGGEGFGIVYLEAGAHGLPVVGAAAGGALDAVVDGETGRLVDPTDHVAIADAIAGLLLDPNRAEALGRAGADRARQLTWAGHAQAVEELIHDVNGRAA